MPISLVIPSVASTGTGPTLATLYRKLADELGFYHQTTVSTLAASGEASRVVLADELRDDEAGYDFFGAPWLYVVDGDQARQQRRVIAQPDVGYQGQYGALMLSRPFTAPLAAGTTVEVTSPLPVRRSVARKGLTECINEALAMLIIEVRLAITGNGLYSYDLSAYPWLTNEIDIQGIYDTQGWDTSYPATLSPYDYRLVTNGVNRTLVTQANYTASDTFELAALVPADRFVYDGASWYYATTPGLQQDSWRAAAPESWVLAFAMVKALQFLERMTVRDHQMPKEDKAATLGEIVQRKQTWARAAADIKVNAFPKPVQQQTGTTVAGTSYWSGWPYCSGWS